MERYSRIETDYVHIPVDPIQEIGAPSDPTSLAVSMTFTRDGKLPDTPTWRTCDWVTDTTTTPSTYYVRCLIGTGGTGVLDAGKWWPHVKIVSGSTTAMKRAAEAIEVI